MYQHGCVAQSMLPLRCEQQATDFRLKHIKLKVYFWGMGKIIMEKYFGTDGFRGEAGII